MVEIARAVLHKAQHHHLRRADREPDAGGEEVLLRPGAQPEGARRVGDLHLARARGGAAAGRPHHRAARRQARGHRPEEQLRPRAHRAGDGRARPVADAVRPAQDQRAAGRRVPAVGAQPAHVGDGEEQLAVGLRRPGDRRLRPGRRRAHRDLQGGRRRRSSATSSTAARCCCAASRCATACRPPGGARRHRLRHRGPQGRRLLRDHVDRAEHLHGPARPSSAAPSAGVEDACRARSASTGSSCSTCARSARTSR